jgi:hypothetical protein
MKAIAERAIASGESAPKAAAEPSGQSERRQVTVLFCDLVDSTALSGAVDPELLGQVIGRLGFCQRPRPNKYSGRQSRPSRPAATAIKPPNA